MSYIQDVIAQRNRIEAHECLVCSDRTLGGVKVIDTVTKEAHWAHSDCWRQYHLVKAQLPDCASCGHKRGFGNTYLRDQLVNGEIVTSKTFEPYCSICQLLARAVDHENQARKFRARANEEFRKRAEREARKS